MKKVILIIMLMMLIGTSCRKKECNCGKVIDKYRMIIDGNDVGMSFIQHKGKVKYITVENNCTKKEVDIKLTEKKVKEIQMYDTWCSNNRKDWK